MLSLTKTSNLIKLCAFISVIVYIGQMLKLGSVVSLCFAISLVCVLAFYWLQVMRHQRVKVSDLLMVAIMALAIVYAGIQTDFDYYKPAIIVLCTVICVDMCPTFEIDKKTMQDITLFFSISAIITNVLYYWGGLRYAYFGTTQLISLNFSNPNAASMWVTCIFIILVNSAHNMESRGQRLVVWLCALSLLPILRSAGARACFIALTFFFFMKLMARIVHMKKLPRWLVFLVTISPVLVFVWYMYIFIPLFDVLSEWFEFFVSTGKPLTSRVEIWGDLEADLMDCLLLGKYATYYSEQMHNTLGTLYGRFGLIFTMLVCSKFHKAVKAVPTLDGQIALCTAWVIGCFETAFFTGMGGLYLLIMILPLKYEKS